MDEHDDDEQNSEVLRPYALRPTEPTPYIVRRWMCCVYGVSAIHVVVNEAERERILHESNDRDLAVVKADYRAGDPIDNVLRAAIVDQALAMSMREHRQLCLVFGVRDVVYLDSRGTSHQSDHLPSGGVRIDGDLRGGSS